jgi:uncharacterized protein YgiM (DUF1202 family)
MLLPYVAVAPKPAQADSVEYIVLSTTQLYSTASTSSQVLGYLSAGDVFTSLSSTVIGGVTWHYTVAGARDSSGVAEYMPGYVTGANIKPKSSSAAPNTPTTGADTSAPASGTLQVTISSGRANVRKSPSPSAAVVVRVPNGTKLTSKSTITGTDGYTWYSVSVNGYSGYIRSDLVKPSSSAAAGTNTAADNVTKITNYQTALLSTIYDSTPVMISPDTTSARITLLKLDTTLTNLYHLVQGTDGFTWYEVSFPLTGTSVGRGYVRGDQVKPYGSSTATSAPSSGGSVITYTGAQYIVSVLGNANMRSGASTGSSVVAKLASGTIVTEIRSERGSDGNIWRYVSTGKQTGYVRSDLLSAIASATAPPTIVITPTPAPYLATDYVIARGYINVVDKVNGGTTLFIMPSGAVATVLSVVTDADKTLWYYINYDDGFGYVSEEGVRIPLSSELTSMGVIKPAATPTPTPVPATPSQVKIGISNVSLRAGPSTSSSVIKVLTPSSLCTYLGTVKAADNSTWYKVTHYSSTGYVRSDLASLVYPNSAMAPAITPPPAGSTAYTADLMAVARGDTNLRSGMGTTFGVKAKMQAGEVLQITGSGTGIDGMTWFQVTSRLTGTKGYVRGDLLRQLTAAELALYSTPVDTGIADTSLTLKYGMTGSDVTKLQNALISLNYLTGSVTLGTYDTATTTAVRKFQQANSLTVDGIAGPATLSKLYSLTGTSIGDTGTAQTPPTSNSVGYSLTTVELNDWFSGNIKAALESSASKITVVSVETKQAFNCKYRWGTQHADCEPLTASDTAIGWSIRNSSGRKDRIPVWVIAGGRTFAGSMYFWEHDSSSDTISGNNYSGIFCLHFKSSTTHTNQNPSASANVEHQKSVVDAYNAAH